MTLIKRLSVVAVFFIVTCGLLTAQISIGARGGFNFAKEYVKVSYAGESESETSEVMTGAAFAGMVEIGLSKYFAVQPELVFIQKGASGKNEGDEIVLNHIELPLLAKFKYSSQYFNAFATAGPTFGYAMSGKYGDYKYKDEDWEGYNRFEIGASIGGGLGLNLKKGTAFVDVRYQFSLNNLAEVSAIEEDYIDVTIKNRGVGVTFGYLYRLGE
ncbi:MAG: PorT family protein [Saprospiraceae bacterium]|nr:PorT family protein [Saprospiraceae bacterium]